MVESLERIDMFSRRPDSWYKSAEWQPLIEMFDEWDNYFFFHLEDPRWYPKNIGDTTEKLVGLLSDKGFDPMPVWEAFFGT